MQKNRQLPSTSSNQKKKKQSPLRSPLQILNTSISSSSSSSISIEPPKGCLRFFSKSPNLCNPRLKSAPIQKPISRSSNPPKENVSKNSFRIAKTPDKSVSKTGPERLSLMCSKKFPKQKKKIFTPTITNGESVDPPELSENPELGIDHFGKLASGSVLKFELDKPKSKAASSTFSKDNPNQKQVIYDESTTDFVEKCTPINRLDKSETVFATNSNTSTTKTTPPVQASVSPEINCASSSSVLAVSAAKTPTCYGAGHIVSGVTDRRKCRARGILTVGQKDSSFTNLDKFENGDDFGVRKSRTSLVPFPVEASMQWLLSPCEELDEDNGTNRSLGHRNVSDFCNFSDSSSSGNTSSGRRSKIILLSPNRNPRLEGISGDSSGKISGSPLSASPSCEVVVLNEVRQNRYDQIMESSPFSSGSLGSGNVIQTPQSESGSDRHVGISCLNASEKKRFDFGHDTSCATEDLLRASLSPKMNRSVWDSSGFSFHLPEFASPSDSFDLSQLPSAWSKGSSFLSNSRSNDSSSSQMRVSWRDGLVSRIFEMDESDFCKCLSDDESDANKSSNSKFKSSLSHETKEKDDMCDSGNCEKGIKPLEYVGHAPKCDGEREDEFYLKRSNPCEESICTDGGELAASGDSDWTSCYKNHLFDL